MRISVSEAELDFSWLSLSQSPDSVLSVFLELSPMWNWLLYPENMTHKSLRFHCKLSEWPIHAATYSVLKFLFNSEASIPLLTHPKVPGHAWGCRRLWGEVPSPGKGQVCRGILWWDHHAERARRLELHFWNESVSPRRPPGFRHDLPQRRPAHDRTAEVRKCVKNGFPPP